MKCSDMKFCFSINVYLPNRNSKNLIIVKKIITYLDLPSYYQHDQISWCLAPRRSDQSIRQLYSDYQSRDDWWQFASSLVMVDQIEQCLPGLTIHQLLFWAHQVSMLKGQCQLLIEKKIENYLKVLIIASIY